MFRSFQSSQTVVLSLVLASPFGTSALLGSSQTGNMTVDVTKTAAPAPLDYDQTHYRRTEGQWQLVDESSEKPYV